jgi:hypothetical protein
VNNRIALPEAREAAAALGQKLLVLDASTADEIDARFASLDREPADAMFVMSSPFFVTRARQIAALGKATPSHPCNLPTARVCPRWRPHELWV